MICCPDHAARHHGDAGADLLGVRFFLGRDSCCSWALGVLGSWALGVLGRWAFLGLGETLTRLFFGTRLYAIVLAASILLSFYCDNFLSTRFKHLILLSFSFSFFLLPFWLMI